MISANKLTLRKPGNLLHPSSTYRYLLTMRHPFLPRLEWAVFSLTLIVMVSFHLLTPATTSKYRIVPHPPLYINILDSRIPLLLLLFRLLRHAQAHARITPLPYSHTIAINFDYLFLFSSLFFFLSPLFLHSMHACPLFCSV